MLILISTGILSYFRFYQIFALLVRTFDVHIPFDKSSCDK